MREITLFIDDEQLTDETHPANETDKADKALGEGHDVDDIITIGKAEKAPQTTATATGLIHGPGGILSTPGASDTVDPENATKALTHNSKLADTEPQWSTVDKTRLPRNAHARMGEADAKSTWGFPHHWVQGGGDLNKDGIFTTGTMYLHRGGLISAWGAAQGARAGVEAEAAVKSHLDAHRKAIGLAEDSRASLSTPGASDAPDEYRYTCPECDNEVILDQPRDKLKCPKCNALLQRKNEAKGCDYEKPKRSEEKAGRRVRTDKISTLEEIKKLFQVLVEKLAGVLSWAKYDDKKPQPVITLAQQTDSLDIKTAIKTFTTKSGETWLLTWTMNPFRDRDGEIFTTQSIEDYVGRHATDDIKGRFKFWHVPGSDFGDIKWQAMSGRFLVEAGPFDRTAKGAAFKTFFAANPNGHAAIAPDGWGTSHGYIYRKDDRDDKIYEWFEKKETSVLPAYIASNPYNPTLEVFQMNEKQKDALREIGGDALVQLVETEGEKRTAELEGTVDYKAKGGFAAQIRALLSDIDDEDLRKRVEAIAAKFDESYPAPEKKDEKGEDEDEQKKEADTELSTGEKTEKVDELIPQLTLLAEQAEGDIGAKLKAIVEAMSKVSEKREQPSKEELVTELAKEFQLDELSKVLQSQSSAISVLSGAVATLVSSTKENLDKISTRLDEVEKTDTERLAEKETLLPRLSWFRASQAAETVLTPDDKLKSKSPKVPNAIAALAMQMDGEQS